MTRCTGILAVAALPAWPSMQARMTKKIDEQSPYAGWPKATKAIAG